jgi:hypothetical protein
MIDSVAGRLIIFSFLAVLAGCAPSLEPETADVRSLSSTIDQYTDSLIAHYGNRFDADSTLRDNAGRLASQLQSLTLYAGKIKCGKTRDIIQPYIGDCRAMYLLSLNPNLNADAFALTLASLNASRARMRALMQKQHK